jgi:hypothetical protein
MDTYYASNETRNLVLRSYDINASNTQTDYFGLTVTTPAGIVADNRLNLTWNNVNLRQMMGNTFYNKFDKFQIRLNVVYIGQTTQSYIGGAAQTALSTSWRSMDIYMSGLPFDPPPYNQGSSTKSAGRVQIGSVICPALTVGASTAGQGVGGITNYEYEQTPSYTFSKTADSPTINIQLLVSTTQGLPAFAGGPNMMGHMQFFFEIIGINKKETFTTVNNNLMKK